MQSGGKGYLGVSSRPDRATQETCLLLMLLKSLGLKVIEPPSQTSKCRHFSSLATKAWLRSHPNTPIIKAKVPFGSYQPKSPAINVTLWKTKHLPQNFMTYSLLIGKQNESPRLAAKHTVSLKLVSIKNQSDLTFNIKVYAREFQI